MVFLLSCNGLQKTAFNGGGRYFWFGGLNDECVRNYVGYRGVWEHFSLEFFSLLIEGSEIASEISFEPKQ